MAGTVRLTLVLEKEVDRMLERIAAEAGTSKAEVLRQALALAIVAHAGKRQGLHLGLIDDPRRLDTEIVGLL
jgi:Ribbon-helix-helix protein, copG family